MSHEEPSDPTPPALPEPAPATLEGAAGVTGESSPGLAPVNRLNSGTRKSIPRTAAERREEVRRALRASLAALPPPETVSAPRESLKEDFSTQSEPAVSAFDRPPLPGVNDLPADVRAALPNIDFTVHVYAQNPSARVVRVNGRMVREGEPITGALRLVEITRGGVVLETRGNRFLMGAQEEWWAR